MQQKAIAAANKAEKRRAEAAMLDDAADVIMERSQQGYEGYDIHRTDVPVDPTDSFPSPPPRKKQRIIASPKQPKDPAPTLCHICLVGYGPGFCTNNECGQRTDQPWESPQNTSIRLLRGKQTITLPPLRNDLTVREKEYVRLATNGPGFPRFDDRVPCSVALANEVIVGAFRGGEYDPPSAQLQQLIQSGKLINIGDAIPKTITAIITTGDDPDTVASLSFNSDGSQSRLIQAASKPTPLTNMTDYMRAVFATIIPSLIEQPIPLIDWCAMTITMMELDKSHGWNVAQLFMQQQLTKSIRNRAPFGNPNGQILRDILGDHARKSTRAALPTATAKPPAPTSAGYSMRPPPPKGRLNTTRAVKSEVCRQWNYNSCSRTTAECRNEHVCSRIATGECIRPTDPPHSAMNCENGSTYERTPTITTVKAKREVKKSGERSHGGVGTTRE